MTSGPISRIGELKIPPLPRPLSIPTADIRRGKYAFPVRSGFYFKDTWGEARGGGRPHRGVDIFAQEGTKVCAVTSGYVTLLGNWPKGAGLTVRLDADDTYHYEFMHLKSFDPSMVKAFGGLKDTFYDQKSIKTGRLWVKAGDNIGEVGRTGFKSNSPTDAHLHFQVYPPNARHLYPTKEDDSRIKPYVFLAKLSGDPQEGKTASVTHKVFSR